MRSGIWQVHEVSSISRFLCYTPNLEERKMTDLMKVGWRQWGRDGPVTCLMQCLLEWKCHLQLRMSRITLPLLASAVTLTSPCLFLPLPPSSSLSTKLETPGPPDSYLGPGSLFSHLSSVSSCNVDKHSTAGKRTSRLGSLRELGLSHHPTPDTCHLGSSVWAPLASSVNGELYFPCRWHYE